LNRILGVPEISGELAAVAEEVVIDGRARQKDAFLR